VLQKLGTDVVRAIIENLTKFLEGRVSPVTDTSLFHWASAHQKQMTKY
jgi:hypothetical protein